MTVAADPVTESPLADGRLDQTLASFNLTRDEYDRIVAGLGRAPNFNELAMFSVLWSEHCCYKNSRHLLKRLPTQGARILQGPGENAGIVAIDDEISIAFKIESHNHPTAVEPFQGATTGVGGILRDIFTMNARPVANLNSLRFGPLEDANNKRLFTEAVAGIAHYGNCVGVPTVAGEVFFDPRYSGNPLVNAMAVGVLYDGAIMASGAKGVGNPVLYVGSDTGKDGMGGAAFASRELDAASREDRPAVQVGDPFAEKLLIESCLEAFATGAIVAAQDMGAAGLTCSCAEMAAKGGLGMIIDLDKTPAREPGMKPFEYLLSESQERMLMVLEKGREQEAIAVFEKWGVPAVIVGEVTDDGRARFLHRGEVVVDVPAALLTDDAPSYPRGEHPPEPAEARARRERDPETGMTALETQDVGAWLERLMGSPNIARPGGVFGQYDRHVRNNTLLASERHGSGVIRLRRRNGEFSGMALAMTTDCNARYVALNPYSGAVSAVAEAARNLACVGALPLAVTDNLNFGAPEKPEIYYQLYYAIEGIKDACLAFETPVTGGNVSLYNEHSGAPILPAPVIGMIGLIENDAAIAAPGFVAAGHEIALVGRFLPTLAGSEYQVLQGAALSGEPPDVCLKTETALIAVIRRLIADGLLASATDVGMGGLLTTLAECACIGSACDGPPFGLSLQDDALSALGEGLSLATLLFGESNGSYVLSYPRERREAIAKAFADADLTWTPLGQVTDGATLRWGAIHLDLGTACERWRTGLDLRDA
ncbi:MAG: phosphoribosylformylglycinamidine synthase subunit PurL [Vampirovibrionales bacterium]|nr:phosphoribosylformylglycinamidine synthase subunit PurL [Vampirovibrionales bacterium]